MKDIIEGKEVIYFRASETTAEELTKKFEGIAPDWEGVFRKVPQAGGGTRIVRAVHGSRGSFEAYVYNASSEEAILRRNIATAPSSEFEGHYGLNINTIYMSTEAPEYTETILPNDQFIPDDGSSIAGDSVLCDFRRVKDDSFATNKDIHINVKWKPILIGMMILIAIIAALIFKHHL